jgi:hypothetical protein
MPYSSVWRGKISPLPLKEGKQAQTGGRGIKYNYICK